MDNFQNYQPNRSAAPQDVAFRDAQSEKQRIAAGTEELKKELMENWKKNNAGVQIFPAGIAALSKDLVTLLLSLETMNAYDSVAKKYGCSETQRTQLAQAVWKIAVQNDWEKSEQILREKMGMEEAAFANMVGDISAIILKNAKNASLKPGSAEQLGRQEEPKKTTVSLPLEKALQAYPKIEQQFIGSSALRMNYSPNPMNPSVRNWITDYHDMLGSQKHGTLERSRYLFQSPNGKNLDAMSRKKLSEVLQSLDEGGVLNIDSENQRIVFTVSLGGPIGGIEGTGSVVNHSISATPSRESSHNFATQAQPLNQLSFSKNAPQIQPVVPHKKPLLSDTGGAHSGGWGLANKISGSQNNMLKNFAPQGVGQIASSGPLTTEEKIFERGVGIGSEDYFQKKNEEYERTYNQVIQQNSGGDRLKNEPRVTFASPQNPGAWKGNQGVVQNTPQAYPYLPPHSETQPVISQTPKEADVKKDDPRIRGNIVDLS